jgi:hypothetical protein
MLTSLVCSLAWRVAHFLVQAWRSFQLQLVHFSVEVGAFLGAGLVPFSFAFWVHFSVFSCNLVQFLSY